MEAKDFSSSLVAEDSLLQEPEGSENFHRLFTIVVFYLHTLYLKCMLVGFLSPVSLLFSVALGQNGTVLFNKDAILVYLRLCNVSLWETIRLEDFLVQTFNQYHILHVIYQGSYQY